MLPPSIRWYASPLIGESHVMHCWFVGFIATS
jgi:hypothetical protein